MLDNSELLTNLDPEVIRQFVQIYLEIRKPRLLVFLASVCSCNGSEVPANQKMIRTELLEKHLDALPRAILLEDGSLQIRHDNFSVLAKVGPNLMTRI